MENFKKFALTNEEGSTIKGSGRVSYSTSVDNGDGTTTITYVSFVDTNGNYTWDAGEDGSTAVVICPKGTRQITNQQL
ncbi:hypothetical protein GOQ30_13045 [Flavobacterium sp. TP390]|uniref:Uncharacterized protein n=1 Tax=Flavobacterium profundi TaxID=1774945 RepID=A0A6I4IT86_9FLAO|nr:hypothetical protein [Flavobacterium profundi]MVO10092.1 hypothetical protein [Flavobacterium profundi]